MEVNERTDGVTVINDAYNANPESMLAALETLTASAAGGRRTVAVLGEMKELGDRHEEEHRTVGGPSRTRHRRARRRGRGGPRDRARAPASTAKGPESWSRRRGATRRSAWLRKNVVPGDVVLVKASRGVALEHVADALLDPPTAEGVPRQ